MVIITDSREQLPYLFSFVSPPPEVITKVLPSGDYSLAGYENQIAIERKTHVDLCGSLGKGRERFEREFQRLAEYDYAALVIECSLSDIFKNPPIQSQMLPKSVFRSLLSWSVKYGVCIFPAPDRVFAEKLTYHLLRFYWEKKT